MVWSNIVRFYINMLQFDRILIRYKKIMIYHNIILCYITLYENVWCDTIFCHYFLPWTSYSYLFFCHYFYHFFHLILDIKKLYAICGKNKCSWRFLWETYKWPIESKIWWFSTQIKVLINNFLFLKFWNCSIDLCLFGETNRLIEMWINKNIIVNIL